MSTVIFHAPSINGLTVKNGTETVKKSHSWNITFLSHYTATPCSIYTNDELQHSKYQLFDNGVYLRGFETWIFVQNKKRIDSCTWNK